MSNMHRIQWFDQQIREGNYPSSRQLAEQFEISRRQAQRDIEYLEISLRAPLVYIARHRGYGYEDKTYVLPLLYMTQEERETLKYLAKRYRQYNYDNAGPVHRVAHLLSRFTDGEEQGRFGRLPVFEANPRLIQFTELLSQAVRDQRVVQIHYRLQDEDSRYTIYPLRLVSKYNAEYIEAYYEQGSFTSERLFRMDFIQSLTVTGTTFDRTAFDNNGEPNPKVLNKPFTATVVCYDPLEGDSWYGYAVRYVGELVYEVDFYDTDSFLKHLLAVPEWRQLKSPKWLRQKLMRRCTECLARLNEE